MKFLDVAGCPGSGKSSLCYPLWADKSVTWDGKLPPAHWRLFLDEITSLMYLVKDHPSFEAVLRMNDRSAKKMATVERMPDPVLMMWDRPGGPPGNGWKHGPFIQTGWVQRILGFGWRLVDMDRDVNLIRRALWLMPASVGVAFLDADLETILKRNKAREGVAATAHENRSYQVPLMLPAIQVAKEVLRERGVAVCEIDVGSQSVQDARAQLIAFAAQEPRHATPPRSCGEVALLSTPPWWR